MSSKTIKERIEEAKERIKTNALNAWDKDWEEDPEAMKVFLNGIESELLTIEKAVREEMISIVEKDSETRTAPASGEAEENFDFGYDTKKREILSTITSDRK